MHVDNEPVLLVEAAEAARMGLGPDVPGPEHPASTGWQIEVLCALQLVESRREQVHPLPEDVAPGERQEDDVLEEGGEAGEVVLPLLQAPEVLFTAETPGALASSLPITPALRLVHQLTKPVAGAVRV